MNRDGPLQSGAQFGFAQRGKLRAHVFNAARLGQGDEGQAATGAGDEDVEILLPVWVGDVVDARRNTVVVVVVAHDDGGGHFGVFALGAGGRAVFAVAGDVENGPQFVLQLQGLLHQLFRASVVVDGRQDGEGRFTGEKDFAGMFHGLLCGKRQ